MKRDNEVADLKKENEVADLMTKVENLMTKVEEVVGDNFFDVTHLLFEYFQSG